MSLFISIFSCFLIVRIFLPFFLVILRGIMIPITDTKTLRRWLRVANKSRRECWGDGVLARSKCLFDLKIYALFLFHIQSTHFQAWLIRSSIFATDMLKKLIRPRNTPIKRAQDKSSVLLWRVLLILLHWRCSTCES